MPYRRDSSRFRKIRLEVNRSLSLPLLMTSPRNSRTLWASAAFTFSFHSGYRLALRLRLLIPASPSQ